MVSVDGRQIPINLQNQEGTGRKKWDELDELQASATKLGFTSITWVGWQEYS
jgi:hypothetical protein